METISNKDFVIEKVTPLLIKKMWGGSRLSQEMQIGESVEVSNLNEISSSINGKNLDTFISEDQLPYIIKLIDTNDNLSVQVHPDDDLASKLDSCKGKTECWVILEAEEDAGIYLGMKSSTTKEMIADYIKDNKNLNDLLNFFPVKRGDFFYVPAGTIHAIGKGIFLFEVQQSSGITYRLWDWNRLDSNGKSRELHIEKGMQAIKCKDVFENQRENIFLNNKQDILINHPDFKLTAYSFNSKEVHKIKINNKERYASISCVAGTVKLNSGNQNLILKKGETCLLNSKIVSNLQLDVIIDCQLLLVQ